jgi:YD repeat-containing protein
MGTAGDDPGIARTLFPRRSSRLRFQMFGVETCSFLPDDPSDRRNLARQRQAGHRWLHSLSEQFFVKLVQRPSRTAGPHGRTINFAYDELNRLKTKTYPDSTTAAYTYDLASRLSEVVDSAGTSDSFTYDTRNRLTQASAVYSFISGQTFTRSYGYDDDSNRTSFTYPQSAGSITYTPDSLNRLSSLTDSAGPKFGYSYDALSRRTQMTRSNNITTNYSYDSVSNLLSVLHNAGRPFDGASYTYDSAGNRTAKTDKLTSWTFNYTYDAIYELTQVLLQGSFTTESYSYDPVGNRTNTSYAYSGPRTN